MKAVRMQSLLWAVIIGVTACSVLVGLLGMSPVEAKAPDETTATAISGFAMQPSSRGADIPIDFTTVFTDPFDYLTVYDLSGNPVAEGTHVGQVRCKRDNCAHFVELQIEWPAVTTYRYKFSTSQAIDPVAKRAVVSGNGTVGRNGTKERFKFTATFEDNGDGRISTTYAASRQDASFMLNPLGSMIITRKR